MRFVATLDIYGITSRDFILVSLLVHAYSNQFKFLDTAHGRPLSDAILA